MVHRPLIALSTALSLLPAISRVLAHGDEDGHSGEVKEMETMMATAVSSVIPSVTANASSLTAPESYFGYPAMSGLMIGHIILMIIAWFFILPIGQPDAGDRGHCGG